MIAFIRFATDTFVARNQSNQKTTFVINLWYCHCKHYVHDVIYKFLHSPEGTAND